MSVASSPPALSRLSRDCLGTIFSFCDPREALTTFVFVCRRFNDALRCPGAHYAAWNAAWSVRDYIAQSPDFVEAYGEYPGAATSKDQFLFFARDQRLLDAGADYARMLLSFQRLREVLRVHLPAIDRSILPGCCSAVQFDECWRGVQVSDDFIAKIPAAIRAYYAILGGQRDTDDEATAENAAALLGLFGSWVCYDAWASNYAMPLEAMVSRTVLAECAAFPFVLSDSGASGGSRFAVLSSEYPATMRTGTDVCPPGSVITIRDEGTHHASFYLARSLPDWFCDWCDGVVSGKYNVVPQHPQLGPHLSPFPEWGHGASECTTRGICVRMSPLLMPTWSSSARRIATFAYRVKMAMVEAPPAAGPQQFRLLSRTWNCTDGGRATAPVQGPGVIGLYPVLGLIDGQRRPRQDRPDWEWTHADDAVHDASSGWFEYCSRTQTRSRGVGTMSGSFAFAPYDPMWAPTQQPTVAQGETFDVRVEMCTFEARPVTIEME